MEGLLHVYSEYSIKECALTVHQICSHAAAAGYKAVALTDKDSMSGTAELVRECKQYGLKPVPGAELTDEGIIVVAKDYLGYQGLCRKLCSGESLEQLFAPGSDYHGHVAAFSGGMEGSLPRLAGENLIRQRARDGAAAELANIEASGKMLEKAEKDVSRQNDKLRSLEHMKEQLGLRTGKNFCKKEDAVTNEPDPDKKEILKKALEKEKEDCIEAERELKRVSARIANARKRLSVLHTRLKDLKEKLQRKAELESVLETQEEMLEENELVLRVSEKADYYKKMFGEFYIELFFHGDYDEAMVVPILAEAAEKAGVQTVLANGTLILEPDISEVYRLHAARFLKKDEWDAPEEIEKAYCLKTEKELAASVEGLISAELTDNSINNLGNFFDSCAFDWEKPNPVNYSVLLAEKAAARGIWPSDHEARLSEELNFARESGLEPALLLAAESGWCGNGNASALCCALGLSKDALDVRSSMDQAEEMMKRCTKSSLVEKCMGKDPYAVSIPVKTRIQTKTAIRLAGKMVSRFLYGNADTLKQLASDMADAVPLSETISGFAPSLMEAFQETDAGAILAMAEYFDGLLSGFEHGSVYAGRADGITGRVPFYRDNGVLYSCFDENGTKDAGLAVFDLTDTDCAVFINDAMHNIYRIRGIRVSVSYEKTVFRNILKSRRTVGIPGCGTGVQETFSSMDAGEFFEEAVKGTDNFDEIYKCAWLKYYYPLEYMLAVLNNLHGAIGLPLIVEECRRLGIKIYGPDINLSQEKFCEENGAIRFGLSAVKGVKQNAGLIVRNRNGCYAGFVDFIVRSGTDKPVVKGLIQSGSFDQFGGSRSALLFVYDRIAKHALRVNMLRRRIQEKEEKLLDISSKQAAKQMEKSIGDDKRETAFLMEALNSVPFPDMEDTARGRLAMEMEALSVPVSPHPMDPYMDYLQNTVSIAAAGAESGIWLAGYVIGYEIIHTKKNKEMAVFELEDKTGKVKVLVWPRTYEKYKKYLKNDVVLKLYGDCRPALKNPKKMEFHPSIIRSPVPKIKQTFILADSMHEWRDSILPQIQPYIDRHGSRVILYDMEKGDVMATDIFVKETELQGIRSARARTFLDIGGIHG